jgi:hypothetical protein
MAALPQNCLTTKVSLGLRQVSGQITLVTSLLSYSRLKRNRARLNSWIQPRPHESGIRDSLRIILNSSAARLAGSPSRRLLPHGQGYVSPGLN